MTWFDFLDFIGLTKQWLKLLLLSALGATVQMYLSEKQFTFFHYLMGCLVALLCAFATDALCKYKDVDPDLTTGFVAISAYCAPHILSGINKLFIGFSDQPLATLKAIFKIK